MYSLPVFLTQMLQHYCHPLREDDLRMVDDHRQNDTHHVVIA